MVLNLQFFSEFTRHWQFTHPSIPWDGGRVHWGLAVFTVKHCASGTGHIPLLLLGYRAVLIVSSPLRETGLCTFFVNKTVNAQENWDLWQLAILMEALSMAQTANHLGQSRAWDGSRQVDLLKTA